MVFRHEYTNGVWVDLEQPTDDEIRQTAKEFSIPERLERELLSPSPLPTVASEGGMSLLVLHFPTQGAEDGETKNQEIDFVIGEHLILTVRYEIVVPLHRLKKLLETQDIVGEKTVLTTDVLLEILFAHLYTSMRDHTNHIADNLSRVEKAMFDGQERTTVRAISNISREFLHIEASLANQEEALRHFFEALEHYNFFGPSFPERVLRILGERSHVAHIVRTHRAIATEMRETNIAILGARQNEIVKTLTTITVIFLPLELITFIFAMHLQGTPLEQNPQAFFIVMAGMFGSVLLTTIYFFWKRWI